MDAHPDNVDAQKNSLEEGKMEGWKFKPNYVNLE